jgi:hypothetical protein
MRGQDSARAEELWTADDGTTCLLDTCSEPPMNILTLVRNEKIVSERRLYGRSSAQMLAQGWRESHGGLRKAS